MVDDQNIGHIVGVIKRDHIRHYRTRLKSGDASVAAMCGVKGDWLGDSKTNEETERRMTMPLCADCGAASSL